ncbi:transposase, partial [Burkholderia vietnamiensis]|uniref:transposase n=1 Tax=Burkholderia vietnamiensis TaxID=60552 RepID=UPI00158B4DD5
MAKPIIDDELWTLIEPLLPPPKPRREKNPGRLPVSNRAALRGLRGHPLQRPRVVYADRGYDSERHRRALRDRGIEPVIAKRRTEHGSGLGKYRWVVERMHAWLHHFR